MRAENLDSAILVMKAAENRSRCDGAEPLNRFDAIITRSRRYRSDNGQSAADRTTQCVSLGMGAEELEQQCVVGLDLCPRKVMTAMVELDETRMRNLLGNELAQLPWNEEIIRVSNQQRRVADTSQAFSGAKGRDVGDFFGLLRRYIENFYSAG